ncbi:MAG: dockerin type I repeat-containing protein [Christensenellales bacterium]
MAVDPLQVILDLNKTSVAVDKGEAVTASWTVTGGEAPYILDYNWDADNSFIQGGTALASGSDTFKPAFGESGAFSLSGRDSKGRELFERREFAITGSPPVDPMTLTVEVNPASVAVDKEETVTGNWSASGGTKPYTFDVAWGIKTAGAPYYLGVEELYQTTKLTDTFQPLYGVSGNLQVSVTDSLGRRVWAEGEGAVFEITGVQPVDPLSVTGQVDKSSVAAGESVKGSWSAEGGKGPYFFGYVWEIREKGATNFSWVESGWDTPDTGSSFSPGFGEEGRLSISVKDSLGRTANTQVSFDITDAPPAAPLVLTLDLDKMEVPIGQEIKASWSASGADAYLFEAYWRVGEGSQGDMSLGRHLPESDAAGDAFTPSFGTRGEFHLSVTDNLGRKAWKNLSFTISGAIPLSPLALTLKLDKETVDAGKGETLTATWAATGGAGGYLFTVDWSISEYGSTTGAKTVRTLRDLQTLSDSLKVDFGTFGRVSVLVTDKEGRTKNISEDFDITGGQAAEVPLQAEITLDPGEKGEGGEPMAASVAITGGTAPHTCAFDWYWKGTAATDKTEKFSSQPEGEATGSEALLPNVAGNGWVEVTVRDKDGRTGIFSHYFSITPAQVARGDANKDGEVDIEDLVAIIDYLVSGKEPLSSFGADANGKNGIDIQDLVWIIDSIIGS